MSLDRDGNELVNASFASLVDALPDLMTCRSRMDQSGPWEHQENLDFWQKFKSNGDRVCSFCGSLHPDDFLTLMADAAKVESDVQLTVTDKRYKYYINRPGVKNAYDGGIKFYTWHLTGPLTEEQQRVYQQAVQNSRDRFEKTYKKLCGD